MNRERKLSEENNNEDLNAPKRQKIDNLEFIYCVFSSHMKFIKIGKTKKHKNLAKRYGTYYLTPQIHLFRVPNCTEAEKYVFELLNTYRITDNLRAKDSELFLCTPYLAKLACMKTQCHFWPEDKKLLEAEIISMGGEMFQEALKSEHSRFNSTRLLHDDELFVVIASEKFKINRAHISVHCDLSLDLEADSWESEGYDTLMTENGICSCGNCGFPIVREN